MPHRLGKIGIVTTADDDDSKLLEDVLVPADLSAGAIGSFLTTNPDSRNVVPTAVAMSNDTPDKAKEICSWMSTFDVPLKKIVVSIDPLPGGSTYCVRWTLFVPLDPGAT